jgi:osmotically-inducible protein OsmY
MEAFARSDEELRREVVDDVAFDVMQLQDANLSVDVTDGVVTLRGTVPTRSEARLLAELVIRVEGVVSVENDLAWATDDTKKGHGGIATF